MSEFHQQSGEIELPKGRVALNGLTLLFKGRPSMIEGRTQACVCGIKFKIVNASDGKNQTITCECGRDIEVRGRVENASFSSSGPPDQETEWVSIFFLPGKKA
jgi:hypothetical protein